MGNTINKIKGDDYVIHVTTADKKGAGTDADVMMILKDKNGRKSQEFKLDSLLFSGFERGKTQTFPFKAKPVVLDEIVEIELWRTSMGLFDEWCLEKIVVEKVGPYRSLYLFTYVLIWLSIYLSIYLSVCLCIYTYLPNLSIYLSVYLSKKPYPDTHFKFCSKTYIIIKPSPKLSYAYDLTPLI